MTAGRAVVLSDLHLGPGGPLTTFRDGDDLAGLMRSLGAGTELVLAGDTFDFLQLPGYAGLDPAAAPDRLTALLDANPAVVRALAAFAGLPGTSITLLPGNHDPELLLDPVRARWEEAIGRLGSVRYADVLHPRAGDRLPVWGRRLEARGRALWVVHGDRWDPANVIDHDAVRRAAAEGRTPRLPAGSHLVFEVLNQIKPDHPWVDELKPELPGVVLLLLYLNPGRTWPYVVQHLGVVWDLLAGSVLAAARLDPRLLCREPVGPGATEEEAPAAAGQALARALARGLGPGDDPDRLLGELQGWVERGPGPRPSGPALVAHGGAPRWLLRAWLRSLREADRFGALDGPDETIDRVARHLPVDVGAVVCGHTHGRRARRAPRRGGGAFDYVNTGTWLPIASLPEGDLVARIDELDAARRWPSDPPRTFAQIEPTAAGPSVRLCSWGSP